MPDSRPPFARWFDPIRHPGTVKNAAYLLLTFPAGIFWFVVSVTLLSMGLGMLVIWVGLFLLIGLLHLWRGGAALHRTWARTLAGVEIETPPDPPQPGGFVPNSLAIVRDPDTWRSGGFLVLLFPLGIAWFTVVVAVWSIALGLLAAPLLVSVIDGSFDFGLFEIDTLPEALLATVMGAFLLPVAARVTNGLATVQTGIARAMLGPSRTRRLEARVHTVTVQREKSNHAADHERRRIERDLHDGAQQRLVALAMELGRAKEKFDTDPEGAREILDDAHGQAKLALEELRNLARGIHPAVLTDRGLDPALSALAARSHIPVQVDYRLEGRLPINVESAAYFVASEALANVGKHAFASIATVTVEKDGSTVVIEVVDDGVGGAIPTGNGLSGLADRVEGLGGRLSVLSPAGGPSLIRAEIPCES